MSAERAQHTPSRYFVNGPVDALAAGGLSILVWIALLVADQAGAAVSVKTAANYVFAFNILLNFPHFFAPAIGSTTRRRTSSSTR